jgi:hypothetical protein
VYPPLSLRYAADEGVMRYLPSSCNGKQTPDETIGCYLRIPSDYIYDGWKIDFKTGEVRVENLEG